MLNAGLQPVTYEIKLKDGSVVNVEFQHEPTGTDIDAAAAHFNSQLQPYVDIPRKGLPGSGAPRPDAGPQFGIAGSPDQSQNIARRPGEPAIGAKIEGTDLTMTPQLRLQLRQRRGDQPESGSILSNYVKPKTGNKVQDAINMSQAEGEAFGEYFAPVASAIAHLAPTYPLAPQAHEQAARSIIGGLANAPGNLGADMYILADTNNQATPLQRMGALGNVLLQATPEALVDPILQSTRFAVQTFRGGIRGAQLDAAIGKALRSGVDPDALAAAMGKGAQPIVRGIAKVKLEALPGYDAGQAPDLKAGLLSSTAPEDQYVMSRWRKSTKAAIFDVTNEIKAAGSSKLQRQTAAQLRKYRTELANSLDGDLPHPTIEEQLRAEFQGGAGAETPHPTPDLGPAPQAEKPPVPEPQAPQAAPSAPAPEPQAPSAEVPQATPAAEPAPQALEAGPPDAAPTQAPAPVTRTKASVLKELEALDAAHAARTRGMGSKMRGAANVGPEDLVYAAKRGKLLVEAGFRGFAEWSAEMIAKLGKAIEPHLKAIYKASHDAAEDPVSRFARAIQDAAPIQADWEKSKAAQRAQQAARLAQTQTSTSGRASYYAGLGSMKGAFERPAFHPIEGALPAGDIDELHNIVLQSPGLRAFERINTQTALEKVLRGELPSEGEINLLAKTFGPDIVDKLLAKRTAGEKILSGIGRYQRFNILSGPAVFGKLGSATVGHALFTPVEEALQAGLKKLPGMKGLVQKAGYEAAGSVKAEGAAAAEYFKGATYKDVWRKLATGKNSLDELYAHTARKGIELQEPGRARFAEAFNRIHGAMKTPLQRSAFARSIVKQADHMAATKVAPTADKVLEMHAQAYADSLQAILRNDNAATEIWNKNVLQALRANGPGGKLAAAGAQSLQPIASVATNFAGRSAEYVGGIPYGIAKVVMKRGVENLSQAEAAAVLRAYKRGGVGLGLIALGYFLPQGWVRVGPHYSPDRAKSTSDLQPGEVEMFGVKLPKLLAAGVLHAPMMQAFVVGSDLRSYDTVSHKLRAAVLGMTESLPLADTAETVVKGLTGSENEVGKGLARYGEGFVPLSQLGRAVGNALDDRQRSPKGFWDELKMVFPWLRDQVPEKKQ